MKELYKHKLDLQFFAEGEDEGNPTEPTLDDFLSRFKAEDILGHSAIQSALDSRIGKATTTAINNARAKWEQEHNENLSEAEKLAKMTKEERARYEFKKQQDTFAQEKAKFERDKLVVATGTELNTLGVDPSLAEIIVGKDAEETKGRMETFTKVFNSAVEKAIENKIKGGPTMKKAPDTSTFTLEQIKSMSPAEINANWEEIQKVLKN